MHGTEGLFFCIFLAILALPVIALILAIMAKSSSSRTSSSLKALESELGELRRALERAVKRLAELEKRSAPPEAEPSPAGVPAEPSKVQAEPRAAPAEPRRAAAAAAPPPPTKVAVPAPAPAPPARPPVAPVPISPQPQPVPVQFETAWPSPPPPAAPAGPRHPAAPPPAQRPPSPPPPKKVEGGWERRFGIALPVWLGAVALTLSGAFLVKYSIDHGLIGPEARVTIAIFFGLALLVAGERLRKRYSMTAQGASAAGIAVLYAAFIAGTVLYAPMIHPWAGFGLIVLTTAAAVALSLRQGIVVAFVGLVGGFFTPYWIGVVSSSPGRLFAYLLLLQGGLLIVTRKREWTGLSGLTLLLGLSAAFQRLFGPTALSDAPWIGLFILLSATAFVFAAKTWKDRAAVLTGDLGQVEKRTFLGYFSLLGAFAALTALAVRTSFGMQEWLFLGIVSLGVLALGRLDREYSSLPWVAFAVSTILQAVWVERSSFRAEQGIPNGGPDELLQMWIVSAGFGLLWAVGGWICHNRSQSPASWSLLSVLGGLCGFGLAWRADQFHGETLPHWGAVSLAAALLYLAAAAVAARSERRKEYGEEHLAAFSAAVTLFASFAIPLELDRHWITVAWALETAALGWLLSKLRVKALGVIGLVVASAVAIRLLLNPSVLYYPLGDLPVLNWILYGYGVPVAAFGLAAYFYGRSGWEKAEKALAWGAGAFGFALLTLEVRQGFHPGKLIAPSPRIFEWATYSHFWIAAGLALVMASRRWPRPPLKAIGLVLMAVSALKIVAVDLLAANPLWVRAEVGSWPVLNGLIYIYGIPALAFAAAAFLLGFSAYPAARVAGWASGILLFALLTLEVRQGFQGGDLSGSKSTLVEWATYSHVWIAAGLALLLARRRWKRETYAHLGLAFLGVSLAKIYFIDLFGVNPLWSHQNVGPWPFFNWLLYIYGAPVLGFALFELLERAGGSGGEFLQMAARALRHGLLLALVTLEVRQFFHPSYLDSGRFFLVEIGTYGHAWLLFAAFLWLSWLRWERPVDRFCAAALYLLAVAKLLLLDILFRNPLLWHQDVGPLPVANWLLYLYALPILVLVLLRKLPQGEPWGSITKIPAGFGSLAVGLVLLTLEVRQFFHGRFLDSGEMTNMENYVYSAAWIAFALALLIVGIWKGGRLTRVSSLVVMLLAVSKVFLFDLRHLKDLYRVGSLLALGVSLLLISYLYQRFVFAEKRDD